MNIAILTEYKKEKGIGHLIRTYSIVNTFRDKSYSIEFIIDTYEDNLLIDTSEYTKFNWLTDNIINSYDAILIDTYSIKKYNWINLRKKSKVIFYIDDGNIAIPFPDIILIKIAIESNISSINPHVIGTKYFPLRKEIKENQDARGLDNEVLVMFGGTDIRELSVTLVPILKKNQKCRFNIVTANPNVYNKIDCTKNISKYLSPPISFLSSLMKRSKFAIVSGGTILYELAYLQIPVIVIEVIDNQKKGIEVFKARKFIEESFLYNDMYLNEKIDNYMSKIINDYSYFQKQAKIGRSIIDGEGSTRITEKIIEYIKDIN